MAMAMAMGEMKWSWIYDRIDLKEAKTARIMHGTVVQFLDSYGFFSALGPRA